MIPIRLYVKRGMASPKYAVVLRLGEHEEYIRTHMSKREAETLLRHLGPVVEQIVNLVRQDIVRRLSEQPYVGGVL